MPAGPKKYYTYRVHIDESSTRDAYGKTSIRVNICALSRISDRLAQCIQNPDYHGKPERYIPFIQAGHELMFDSFFDDLGLILTWQHYNSSDGTEQGYCQMHIDGYPTYQEMDKQMKFLKKLVRKGANLNDPASVVEVLKTMNAVHVEHKEYTKYQGEMVPVSADTELTFRTTNSNAA